MISSIRKKELPGVPQQSVLVATRTLKPHYPQLCVITLIKSHYELPQLRFGRGLEGPIMKRDLDVEKLSIANDIIS